MKEITIEFQQEEFTLRDICERCLVDAETVIDLVSYGIVEPVGSEYSQWRFSSSGYLRIRKALRLKKDLAINDAGVALAIDLLERLQDAHREIEHLRQRLDRAES